MKSAVVGMLTITIISILMGVYVAIVSIHRDTQRIYVDPIMRKTQRPFQREYPEANFHDMRIPDEPRILIETNLMDIK